MCNLVLGSHTVNFVMLLDLYYERCFLRKEVSVMMLLSEGSFDAVCATVVSDCGSPIGVACSECEVLGLEWVHAVALVVFDALPPSGLYSLPGSSVHEIIQAKVLEWVAMPSSKESSQPRDQTHISFFFFFLSPYFLSLLHWQVVL